MLKSGEFLAGITIGVLTGIVVAAVLFSKDPSLVHTFAAAGSIAVVATMFAVIAQARTAARLAEDSREAVRGQNYFTLVRFLQDSEIRESRGHVLGQLSSKKLNDWSPEDKDHASRVSSSYDCACIAYSKNFIDKEIFRDGYGPSITACFNVLSEFVSERQGQRGHKYWDDFPRVAREISKLQGD